MKDPTEELTVHILSSLWSWDISLTLNMTYFFFYVVLFGKMGNFKLKRLRFRIKTQPFFVFLLLRLVEKNELFGNVKFPAHGRRKCE